MSEGKCSVEAREQGTSEAIVYILPGEGSRSLRVFGELVVYKTKSERTGGAYSLFEVVTQPESGPPPHVQHREDESFYVLEGEYEFFEEGRILRAAAGSLLYVPRGNLHAHKNVGTTTGRMLLSQTPGGLHERFFEEVGEPTMGGSEPLVSEGPQDMKRIIAIAVKYGIEIPPPLSW